MSESHTAARSALWERHTEAHSALSELANTPEASKALHKVETALEDFEKGGQAAKVKAKESKSSLRGRWPALSYDDRNNPKLTSLQHSLEYLDSHFKGASDAVTAYKDSVRHLSSNITGEVYDAASEAGRPSNVPSVFSPPPSVAPGSPTPTNARSLSNRGEAPTV